MPAKDNTQWLDTMKNFNSVWGPETQVRVEVVGALTFRLFKKGDHGEFTIEDTDTGEIEGRSCRIWKFSDAESKFNDEVLDA